MSANWCVPQTWMYILNAYAHTDSNCFCKLWKSARPRDIIIKMLLYICAINFVLIWRPNINRSAISISQKAKWKIIWLFQELKYSFAITTTVYELVEQFVVPATAEPQRSPLKAFLLTFEFIFGRSFAIKSKKVNNKMQINIAVAHTHALCVCVCVCLFLFICLFP